MCHLSRHIYLCPTKKKIVTVQFRNGMVVYRLHGEYVMFTYKGGNVQHFSCKNRSHHLFFPPIFIFICPNNQLNVSIEPDPIDNVNSRVLVTITLYESTKQVSHTIHCHRHQHHRKDLQWNIFSACVRFYLSQ